MLVCVCVPLLLYFETTELDYSRLMGITFDVT